MLCSLGKIPLKDVLIVVSDKQENNIRLGCVGELFRRDAVLLFK